MSNEREASEAKVSSEPTSPIGIMGEQFDNLIGRPHHANQSYNFMNTDKEYGKPDPTKLRTRAHFTDQFVLKTPYGPGYVESNSELGSDWFYHSSKPENQPVYEYNSVGHRTPFELKTLPDRKFGVAIGCSVTEGIGLKLETTYHQEISRRVGFPIYNCGIGAAGNDISHWNFMQIMRRYRPALVIIQLSGSTRFLLNNCRHEDGAVSGDFTHFRKLNLIRHKDNDELEFLTLANKLKYDRFRTQSYMESIKTVCDITKTGLVFIDAFMEFGMYQDGSTSITLNGQSIPDTPMLPISKGINWVNVKSAPVDYARDRWHHGCQWHQVVADRTMELLGRNS